MADKEYTADIASWQTKVFLNLSTCSKTSLGYLYQFSSDIKLCRHCNTIVNSENISHMREKKLVTIQIRVVFRTRRSVQVVIEWMRVVREKFIYRPYLSKYKY